MGGDDERSRVSELRLQAALASWIGLVRRLGDEEIQGMCCDGGSDFVVAS